MGREVRRVPKDWEHPKDSEGAYIPLLNGWLYEDALTFWLKEEAKWGEGLIKSYKKDEWIPIEDEYKHMTYTEFAGEKPLQENYMPVWREEELTHIMMYENTSEGTPISPVFRTQKALAMWLAETGAPSFGNCTATYEQWLSTIEKGYSIGAVLDLSTGKLVSGVEYDS